MLSFHDSVTCARLDDRKLYLGPRLRLLRRELGLNQTRMAEELGVSPSYLNHLERNQRPLTAQMLLRLAGTYDIDVRDFVSGARDAATSDLHEIFSDALVRDIGIARQEVLEVAENYPSVADAIGRFYRALTDLRQVPHRVDGAGTGQAHASSPIAWLRDAADARHHHFPELDAACEALAASLGDDPDTLLAGMKERLADRHGTEVQVVPQEVLRGTTLRHYDYHRRRLLLSETLAASSRLFGVAQHLGWTEFGTLISEMVARAEPPDRETAALARTALAAYSAAAIAMPYARFHGAAEASRYDLDLLGHRFGASFEQVAHRLTTLNRQTARGVPFFLLKLDLAGNVSKRIGGEALPLARFGGGCPRWRVHRALRHPGELIADLAEMPDASRWFALARSVPGSSGCHSSAIVIGCEAKHMARIAAADPLAQAEPGPIGPACHLCERRHCPERALPPIARFLEVEPLHRDAAPYPFRPT